jgi:hypothetical protein
MGSKADNNQSVGLQQLILTTASVANVLRVHNLPCERDSLR